MMFKNALSNVYIRYTFYKPITHLHNYRFKLKNTNPAECTHQGAWSWCTVRLSCNSSFAIAPIAIVNYPSTNQQQQQWQRQYVYTRFYVLYFCVCRRCRQSCDRALCYPAAQVYKCAMTRIESIIDATAREGICCERQCVHTMHHLLVLWMP